jgi:hypothetical protein
MRARAKTLWGRALLLVGAATLIVAAAGCGDEEFANAPRPPATVELSSVIRDDGVGISPTEVGAGRITITFSNQTDRAHSITLEGEDVIERTATIQPQDTATITKTLQSGSYEIRAGSSRAVDIEDQIPPATLRVGSERPDSNNDLLQP